MTDPLSPIKVGYNRNTEIKIDQPEDVTRAKAAAWLDIISPVTQWAGLKGDALKHKRDLLRLEREATLEELAIRMHPKLEGKTITPIPTKQLIPALEKASLEEPTSDFVEKWANLLASAALSPGDDVAICTSILADLGSIEAQVLEEAGLRLRNCGLWSPEKSGTRVLEWRKYIAGKYGELSDILADHVEDKIEWTEAVSRINAIADTSPNIVINYNFAHRYRDGRNISLTFDEKQKIAIDVLRYRNLIETDDYWEMADFKGPKNLALARGTLTVQCFKLTNLGITFLRRVAPSAETMSGN